VFGGWGFDTEDLDADWVRRGYAVGVPMGGELRPPAAADTGAPSGPTFLVMATADPESAHLDRIQIIKGWLEVGGEVRERVIDVAWAGPRVPAADGELPAVGDSVDRSRGTVDNAIGAASLQTAWQDPDFDPAAPAFYYVRVLQIPTARHALLDALALGLTEPTEGPSVIQERAYSSAIWYRP
jgi:hypothetical protein